ncbi:hypothetical protein GCM10010530_63760 [Kribbella aluminosa]
MYGFPGYPGSTASPSNPPSAEAFTPSTAPTSATRPPATRTIFPASRSVTNALLSGRNAKPQGTWIPVATVDATVNVTAEACAVPADAGADEELVPPGVASEHPAAITNETTATAAALPRTPSPPLDLAPN